jgi:exodeoxyribonuclease-3
MIKIISWNVNSIRSRLEHLLRFVDEQAPDVLLLQETKCIDHKFPHEFLDHLGYNMIVHGEKSYNGVAIMSKGPIEDVRRGLPGDESDTQARYLEAVTTIDNHVLRVASVYVPNGQSVGSDKFHYKLRFLERMTQYAETWRHSHEMVLIGGDYNVAPEEIDVYNPKHLDGSIGFHPVERQAIRGLMATNMMDAYRIMHPNNQVFSWWDYRSGGWQHNRGMRIDYILASPSVCDHLVDAGVYDGVRGWKTPSDHAPVYVCLG